MKTFVKIKSGILSPKHYEAIGPAIWLFLYLLQHTDWETGTMHGYTDEQAAEELGSKKRTVRSWRMKLQAGNYITWKKKPYSLNIMVSNWDNPNLDWSQTDTRMSRTIESDIESDIEPTRRDGTHHPYSDNRLQTTDNNYADATIQNLFVTITGMLTFPSRSKEQDLTRLRAIAKKHKGDRDAIIRYCAKFFQEWRRREYSKSNTNWLDWAIADDIPKRKGKGNGKDQHVPDHTPEEHAAAASMARQIIASRNQ